MKKAHKWQNLVDPLTDIMKIPSIQSYKYAFFLGDLRSIESGILEFIRKILNLNLNEMEFEITSFSLNKGIVHQESISLSQCLIEFPFSTKYLFSLHSNCIIYDAPRDGLSVFFTSSAISDKNLYVLDQKFRQQTQCSGIGFGQEGRNYLKKLIESCVLAGLTSSDRFPTLVE